MRLLLLGWESGTGVGRDQPPAAGIRVVRDSAGIEKNGEGRRVW